MREKVTQSFLLYQYTLTFPTPTRSYFTLLISDGMKFIGLLGLPNCWYMRPVLSTGTFLARKCNRHTPSFHLKNFSLNPLHIISFQRCVPASRMEGDVYPVPAGAASRGIGTR
jgi:hypothetical protein